MSFKGELEAKCPKCDEAQDVEVWSYVRGDADENLRSAFLAGDLNVVECQQCHEPFVPDATVVYADPSCDLVAFIFPDSYENEREVWEDKMNEDYAKMKPVAEEMGMTSEPLLFFGLEEFRELLEALDALEDEAQIAEHIIKELKLVAFPVDPAFARTHRLPRVLPLAPKTGPDYSAKGALLGIHQLLEVNDRLEAYLRWEAFIEAGGAAPPRARKRVKR